MAAAQSQSGNIARVASGNFLEMYDFIVFGYYAPNIAHAFFPGGNEFLSLMLTLMTFGAGFLMRPVGAAVLGAYTDHHGRRAGLLMTLSLMAVGTLSLAATPSYARIGVAAPLLVVIGRLVQGFSAGAELGTVSVYLAEIAPPGRTGIYVAWQSASQQIAVVFSAILGLGLNRVLAPAAMNEWGWRVPLLLGCALIPLLYVFRRSLAESEVFLARPRLPLSVLLTWMARSWPIISAGAAMVAMTTVSFYLLTAYMPTFAKVELNLSSQDSFIVTFWIGVSNFIWLFIGGAFSDRLGRRPLLLLTTLAAVVTAYPLLAWLVAAPSFAGLLAAGLWLSFLYGCYNGAMVPYLVEIIPAEIRAGGFSLAYSLATALLGGFTPAISTALIHATGDKAMPGAWLGAAGLLGMIGWWWVGHLKQGMASASPSRS
jgi:MFS family permease